MKKYQLVIHLKGLKIICFNEIKIFQDSPVKTSAQYAATGKKKKIKKTHWLDIASVWNSIKSSARHTMHNKPIA